MNETEKLRRAFIASTVSLIVTGILFIITMFATLVQISSVVKETQPIERPLTECKE